MTHHLNKDFDFDRIRNIWKNFMLVFKIINQSSSIIQRIRKSIRFKFINTIHLEMHYLIILVGVSLCWMHVMVGNVSLIPIEAQN